ncbi:MAG: transcriptional regulator [Propionibacteriales bacterium]|nr:transcriptional regulator [Propionibacteriales bacterium]
MTSRRERAVKGGSRPPRSGIRSNIQMGGRMPRPREADRRGPAWQVQAASLARRFHLEGRSKTEIAREFGMSRFKVARLLDEAREHGLVEVNITLPTRIDDELSSRLRQEFGLSRAIVVDVPDTSAGALRSQLGGVAADLLAELTSEDAVLGLSCSRTIAATTDALTRLARCTVVQLTGTLAGPDIEAGSVESVRRAAKVGGGKAFPIYGPLVLPDGATARALAVEPSIRQAMERFAQVEIAMVAIGAWADGTSTVWSTVGEAERASATRAGAVGEIGGRFFGQDGEPVKTRIDDRILGVTLPQLRDVPEVVGLVYHPHRAAAALAALRGRLVDTIVTDTGLARRLLEAS